MALNNKGKKRDRSEHSASFLLDRWRQDRDAKAEIRKMKRDDKKSKTATTYERPARS